MKLDDLLTTAAHTPLTTHQLTTLNNTTTGLDATLGIRYLHVAHSLVRTALHVAAHHLQPAGLVNGGVYCALAESTASLAGMITAGSPVVGINNNTDFIASVHAGIIEAEATPLQLGRRTQLWEITMHNKDHLVARSTLRTMVLDKP